jgi:DNA polymerase III delta prime subunit
MKRDKLPFLLYIILKFISYDHRLTNKKIQIVEILTYISKRENFDLHASFAATIATQSRQNMREAILALEACKSNKYCFSTCYEMFSFPLDLYALWF